MINETVPQAEVDAWVQAIAALHDTRPGLPECG